MKLYVNLAAQNLQAALVRSQTTMTPVRMVDLVIADTTAFEIYLCDGAGNYDASSGADGYSLRVGVGLPGVVPPAALQGTWTQITNGWSGQLDLGTTQIDELLGDKQTVAAYFEIELTDPAGKRHTVAQVPVVLRNEVVDETGLTPVELESFYTSDEADVLFVARAGDGMSGPLVLSGDPTSSLQAATKQYVDSVAQGLDPKSPVRIATPGPLGIAYTWGDLSVTANANGAFPAIDGVTLALGDSILLKDETGAHATANGIYTLANAGSVSEPWTLLRRNDADTNAKVTNGLYCLVLEGAVNGQTAWVLTTNDPITLGATSLTFTQFASMANKVSKSGDTMTGLLVLSGDPTSALNAATKQYVDAGDATNATAAAAASANANGRVAKSGDTMTGALTVPQVKLSQSAATYGATTTLDFDGSAHQTLALTGDVAFATTHRLASSGDPVKIITIRISAGASNRNLTFPAWNFMGTAPTSLAAGKIATLTLACYGTAETDVDAAYAAQS